MIIVMGDTHNYNSQVNRIERNTSNGRHLHTKNSIECRSGYTQEKICSLNDHFNDDCNSSLECEFSRGTSLYTNTCTHKSKGHVSSASQKMIWMFLRTQA